MAQRSLWLISFLLLSDLKQHPFIVSKFIDKGPGHGSLLRVSKAEINASAKISSEGSAEESSSQLVHDCNLVPCSYRT